MGEARRRATAGHVPAPRPTDRDLVELAIPAVLISTLVFADVFGPDPDEADQIAAQIEVAEKSGRLKALVIDGVEEPFRACTRGQRRRLVAETADVCGACVRVMGFEEQSSVKFAMTYYHWLEDLLARDVLSLVEGSSMGEAVTLLMPMFDHGFERERQDASARKQAARMLRWFQGRGYYTEAVGMLEAAE